MKEEEEEFLIVIGMELILVPIELNYLLVNGFLPLEVLFRQI